MKTGLLIKELRIKKGLTQEELADLTELSSRTIQRIENGEVDPRAYTLQMIAKALEVDFSLFVEDEAEDNQELQKIGNKNWSALIHLSGLFPLLFPTLLLWNRKKDKTKDLANHFHAAVTLQLCIWVISIIGLWIYWKVSQPIPLIIGLLIGCFVSIMNAIFVTLGKSFINPFIENGTNNRK
ncbi:MAG: helix-turn-helix domain-containing protein [Prolixibacteraceae bacterium]|nr:helix-turn-helix domain-containing protein [Prolixibacteraceae bacterium]